MDKKNVIWFLIDGVRNYPAPDDPLKLGKPAIFDELAKEGVEFQKAVSSATSTSMSITSALTGIPSYYLGITFEDFFTDSYTPPSLGTTLVENGYMSQTIAIGADFRRDRWSRDLPHVEKRYWPKGAYRLSYWHNSILPVVLENLLKEEGLKEPFFLYIHFNGRRDADIGDRINRCIQLLDDLGYYEDSVVLMCSDHGMPDDSRSNYTSWLKEQGLSYRRHDLVMTDDNILVPMVLSYPGVTKGQKISEPVGTIDIFPTLLDILNIEFPKENRFNEPFFGRSLLPLINDNGENTSIKESYLNRKFRTDTRFMGQRDRISSVRGNRYKYVYAYDVKMENREQFYDLENDPFERNNLLNMEEDESMGNIIMQYRNSLLDSNKSAQDFQIHIRKIKLDAYIDSIKSDVKFEELKNILIIGTCKLDFAEIAFKLLKQSCPDCEIDFVFWDSELMKDQKSLSGIGFRNNIWFGEDDSYKNFKSKSIIHPGPLQLIQKYDLILVPFTQHFRDIRKSKEKKTEGPMLINIAQADVGNIEKIDLEILKDYKEIFRIVKILKADYKSYFDGNFKFFTNPKREMLRQNWNKVKSKKDVYYAQPSLLLDDIKKILF